MSGTFTTANELFAFSYGFFAVFIGDFIIGRTKTASKASPFVRFLLATAFAYTAEVIKDIVFFFIDFYKGTALQGYNMAPSENILFFKIFGTGQSAADQFPLFFINIGSFDMLLGCAIAGAILWTIRSLLQRKKAAADG